jgi:hypothetical protein
MDPALIDALVVLFRRPQTHRWRWARRAALMATLAIAAVIWAMGHWSQVAAQSKTAVLIYSELAALGVCLVAFIVAIRICYEERNAFDKRPPVTQTGTSASEEKDNQDK